MKYSDQEIIGYLESITDIDLFFTLKTDNMIAGIIHYVDRDKSNVWAMIEDRDDVVDACIEFLKKRGNLHFSNNAEADEYGERLVNNKNES